LKSELQIIILQGGALYLHEFTKGQLREALSDAAAKLAVVKETVRNIPEAYIPFSRLQEITFLEQRIGEYRAELIRRWTSNTPVSVFYSYSHHDHDLLIELDERLSRLKEEGLIEIFWDRRIAAGLDWHTEITEELCAADIILAFVSPDFLASPYCGQVELPAAMALHNDGLARVVPVIVRTCAWQQTPLGRLQALPSGGRPVMDWPDSASVYAEIADHIRAVVNQVRQTSP
jgi:hypothetical protein